MKKIRESYESDMAAMNVSIKYNNVNQLTSDGKCSLIQSRRRWTATVENNCDCIKTRDQITERTRFMEAYLIMVLTRAADLETALSYPETFSCTTQNLMGIFGCVCNQIMSNVTSHYFFWGGGH